MLDGFQCRLSRLRSSLAMRVPIAKRILIAPTLKCESSIPASWPYTTHLSSIQYDRTSLETFSRPRPNNCRIRVCRPTTRSEQSCSCTQDRRRATTSSLTALLSQRHRSRLSRPGGSRRLKTASLICYNADRDGATTYCDPGRRPKLGGPSETQILSPARTWRNSRQHSPTL